MWNEFSSEEMSRLFEKVRLRKRDAVLIVASFVCYTGMYAVRKSFLAGEYAEAEALGELSFKTALIISQVMGYMISKFIGIRWVSEISHASRLKALLGFVGFGLAMLGVFALVPGEMKLVAIFLSALPLGMVFGLVLTYLEGRRSSELLVAGLSATFIFSTGFIKSVGLFLMDHFGVGEFAMPVATAVIFFPFFIISVMVLQRSPEPDADDVAHRTQRVPMSSVDRKAFMKRFGFSVLGMILVYVVLTVVRDFRDNFIVEYWSEILESGVRPALVTLTEVPISVVVISIAAIGILFRSNVVAYKVGLILTLACGVGLSLVTLLYAAGFIGAVLWVIVSGVLIYIPYILFHCMLFERFLAMVGEKATVGFLFYQADSAGYLLSVIVLLFKELGDFTTTWNRFFITLNIWGGIGVAVFSIWVFVAVRRSVVLPRLSLKSS